MSSTWVPPSLAWEITPLQLEVLMDTASPLAKRKQSPMFGGLSAERAFNALSDKGLIVWKQVHSVYASSQTDHYEVTAKGMRMLDKIRKAAARIGKPKKAKR